MTSAVLDEKRGQVLRIVSDRLAYVVLLDTEEVLPIEPHRLSSYRGESFAEMNIHELTFVDVALDRETCSIFALQASVQQSDDNRRRADNLLSHLSKDAEQSAEHQSARNQQVLDPQAQPTKRAKAFRAINPETRAFGKLIDCELLHPGDLFLSQDLHPDDVTKLITDVQLRGGYRIEDARWTHAAMYLGDGANVVEATFDDLYSPGSVRITSLDQYCTGKHALRFRRSRYIGSAQEGWHLCVRALTRLKIPYNFAQAVRIWWSVVVRKTSLDELKDRRPTSEAVICSTLYADAYLEATRRRLGEVGGVCVPAWLSGSDEFEDLTVGWSQID